MQVTSTSPSVSPSKMLSKKSPVPYWLLGLALIVVVGLALSLARTTKKTATTNQQSNFTSRLTDQPNDPNTYFEQIGKNITQKAIVVKSWNILGADVASSTSSARLYPLFHDVSGDWVKNLMATLVGDENIQVEEQGAVFTAAAHGGNDQLSVDKKSATFQLTSKLGVPLPTLVGQASDTARVGAYLKNAFSDPTLEVISSYGKKGEIGVVYYEAQRSWSAVGLPIVNPSDFVTYAKDISLAQWTQTPTAVVEKLVPQDELIVKSSDSRDGKARLNASNTITVKVQDGRVISVNSTARLIDGSSAITSDGVVPALEALTKLTRGQYDAMYAIAQVTTDKSGQKTDRSVTSDVLTSARVLQGRLMYLEMPKTSTQTVLEPYYVFQGTGSSDRGYAVSFLAVVAASQHPPALPTPTPGALSD